MSIDLRRRSDRASLKPKPKKAFDFADQEGLITGSRIPTTRSIMDHLWLYRRDRQSARQIGLALNCQPTTVLQLLLKMQAEGQVDCYDPNPQINEDSPWGMPS